MLGWGCTQAVSSKMNAELRHQIKNNGKEIHFSGECASEITPPMRQQIEQRGIRIKTVKGLIFTATGTPRRITNLSRLKFIVRLEVGPKYRYKVDTEETNP
jgi:hypothetical protein